MSFSDLNKNTHDHDELVVSYTNQVYRLVLNTPGKFNVLSEAMLTALQSAIDDTPEDARVLVIAARGKAFCAGHDLKQMRQHPDQHYYEQLFKQCSRFMNALIALPLPVIAEVQGLATAAGCQLVANCDLAIAAEEATFAVSGLNVGLFCSTPSVPLSRNISRKRAFEMLMTGDFITAEKAVEWGLLNASVPADQLEQAVLTLCEKIKSKPASAIHLGKDLFYKQIELPLEQAYQAAGNAMACNMMQDETSEGIDAFIEKRKPRW